ncbi:MULTISPECIES: NAD+ synthase [Marinomonas]|uniref:Glutamine-dependent NAD(+) synthetase n=1 Tax=Marinomonas arctica TaxID=383750 RepID=A0A7H1JA75_9GAMM|nr:MULTISPECIES: NAD+ synthase [Marinomonas]MCS7486162.1 NAD synthetase [Marinomonas sp. BSi20414]QNT07391.1 NAD+ synthase [Marinomonas arctica]GGN27003.1 NAD+ synthase [Marinomonas arctica]
MTLRIAMAQLDMLVGDITKNTQSVIDAACKARDEEHADVVVFPELTLTGYPPEDLLLRPSLDQRIESALATLLAEIRDIYVVVGYPRRIDGELFNCAGVIYQGDLLVEYAKQKLPNFLVFDDKRYFSEGREAGLVDIKGVKVGLSICEDIWHPEPIAQAKAAGAELILNLNASPYHIEKMGEREALLHQRATEVTLPIVYVNYMGAQDELVYEGGSFVVNAKGEKIMQAPWFEAGLYSIDMIVDESQSNKVEPVAGVIAPALGVEASVYQAMVLGLRDYITKNRFKGIVLGLSGGIDSALSLAVAVDAIGAERVQAVMMPYTYTSSISLHDAEEEANLLGVKYSVLPIETMVSAFTEVLAPEFEGYGKDTTEENLQARTRGVTLMAISNKKGYMVLTTGNKSEMAVGYATLYGDMVGGYSVLKDVFKTLVFKLCRYRNTLGYVIPERVITRPPSAELAPDQKDEDSLPSYDILDEILRMYIEEDQSAEAILATQKFDRETVYRVLRLVDVNEYKRRQSPTGVRITARGFGRDRRYPITNGWHIGE